MEDLANQEVIRILASKKKKKSPKKASAYNRFVGQQMKAGKSMKQAAAAWKGKGTTKTSSKGGTRKVAKKKSHRRSGFNTQKVFKYVRLAALAGPAIGEAMSTHSTPGKIQNILQMYTGYNIGTQVFDFSKLAQGYLPFLGATVATYGIPKLAGILRGL